MRGGNGSDMGMEASELRSDNIYKETSGILAWNPVKKALYGENRLKIKSAEEAVETVSILNVNG